MPTTGPTFYLDCQSGLDTNSGASPSQAWRNIARANRASLTPGSTLALKRGCTWAETLYVRSSGTASNPVWVGAYGSGARPAIRNAGAVGIEVSGSYLVLDNLEVSANPPAPNPNARNCASQPQGKQEGVLFVSGASNDVLQNSKVSGMSSGVRVLEGTKNKIVSNEFAANNVMEVNTPNTDGDDVGAQAVVLNSDDNEVAYNTFWGHKACSEDFGEDGAAVEIYQGSRNLVHHNRSTWGDSTFTELGGTAGRLARDNVFAFNLYVASGALDGEMLVVRGAQSSFGANPGTKLINNTAFWVSLGTSCFQGCTSSILSSHNNIFVQRDAPFRGVSIVYADAPFDEGHNLYIKSGGGTLVNIEGGGMSATSRVSDPAFVDPWNGNFALGAGSPAIGAGALAPLTALGFVTDLAGNRVPSGGAPDAGAFERP